MTFFHFVNCMALSYVPYLLTYKLTALSEYGTFWRCVQAGCLYLATQLVKMLLLATFFPETDGVMDEILKNSMDVADLVGLHCIMTYAAGRGEMKFMVTGMGWAFAELVMTRFLPLWLGARGVEFQWKYVQLGMESNMKLVEHLAVSCLLYLWGRGEVSGRMLAPLLLLNNYMPSIISVIIQPHLVALSPWSVLLVKAAITFILSLTALHSYHSSVKSINSYF